LFFVLEPRGLIRLLQFIFAIFAFATACTGGSNLSINDKNNNQIANVEWDYPYDLRSSTINTNYTSPDAVSNSNSIKPSAEFFVFTGVTSMLLSLAFTIIYVLMNRQYHNDERIPIIDFVLTLIWTIFWIAGSSAWAQGVSDIRTQTSYDYVSDLIDVCNNATTAAICDNYDCKLFVISFFSISFIFYYSWYLC
jgi:occludin/MAL family lipid-associated protein